MAESSRILIVGAGIVGASIAWHLAKAGARVTVVDAAAPGGVATRASWAWINASWGNPLPYFRLRVRAMEEWRRVEREVPGIAVAWTGGLLWEVPPDELREFAAEHASWGYPLRLIEGGEVAKLEPALADPPALAVHASAEGAVEPVPAALAFLAAAEAHGARVVASRRVTGLAASDNRVTGVGTDQGPIAADEVVVAAGVATPALLQSVGVRVPLRHAPGLIVDSGPVAPLLNHLLIPPGMELRQTADGRLLAAADIAAGADSDARAHEVFDAVRGMLRGGERLVLRSHTVGFRPMPSDGFPFIGRSAGIDGLYTAVTHSGVTLAPAIGAFAADEILNGRRNALLAPYGLERAGPAGTARQPGDAGIHR